jgi:outer membrane murein-binding lipoprotein Lpp
MMLCNKLSTDVKTLCDKKLNDEAFDWKMRTIAEQKAAKKKEESQNKKRR